MISNASMRSCVSSIGSAGALFVGYLQIECHTYWLVGRAGHFALCAACQVERAGEGLRVRFFGLGWG